MKLSIKFGIMLYIVFAVFTIIIPLGLLYFWLPGAASELIRALLLGLGFLLLLTFIIYRIFSDLYYFIKGINGNDLARKQSVNINVLKFVGIMPIYEQLERLSHEYRVLHSETQILFDTKQTQNRSKKNSIIEYDITGTSNTYKLENLMDISVKTFCDLTNANSCSIMLYNKRTDALKIVASFGLPKDLVENLILKPGYGIAGRAFQEKKSIMVKDILQDPLFVFSPNQKKAGKALFSVPLKTSDECIGVINIDTETPLPEDKCKLIEVIASQISIAIKNALLFKSMEELAIRDSLTGLYNHRYFQQTLTKETERALRYKRPLSLVILDIDNFKQYNDNYGHMLGDYLLKEMGRVIQNSLRASDVLARYGGDELAIILPETDEESAYILLERVRKYIFKFQLITPEVFSNKGSDLINKRAKNLLIKSSIWDHLLRLLKRVKHGAKISMDSDHNANVTVSAGICSLSETVSSKEDLVKKADEALLKAKRIGKNQICIYNSSSCKQ